ncbi:hypothetical protein QEZ48_08430 [Aquamicrobium lusatiense]|uniref:cold-shock protein n=1 Tax=Aquamicrobium lusatiense TaxID=89772 RepID=UPI0024551A3A|nr:hypothetical protein [Aquamicrobium lusatiense]MDH4990856.1 hypothetical protein [Aquamicrobium lusatiense]
MPGLKQGWVRHWGGNFGFVKETGTDQSYFALSSVFEAAGLQPERGLKVRFTAEDDPRGPRVTWLAAA